MIPFTLVLGHRVSDIMALSNLFPSTCPSGNSVNQTLLSSLFLLFGRYSLDGAVDIALSSKEDQLQSGVPEDGKALRDEGQAQRRASDEGEKSYGVFIRSGQER